MLCAQRRTAGDYPYSRQDTASYARGFIHRLEVEGRAGHIFTAKDFLEGENMAGKRIATTRSAHLKYALRLRPRTAGAQAYIDAYQGIGLGYFDFGNRKELGSPFALYLFQGGSIARLSRQLSLNYEWNFGASYRWKPYDKDHNPYNKVIGSDVNAYLNVNLHLNWSLSPLFDLTVGATGTHFSNGNTQYPNSGLNTVDCKVGLIYNFNRRADDLASSRQRTFVPPFSRHVSYDLTLFGTWRKKAVTLSTDVQVAAPHSYTVWGFNFAPMYNFGYKFRAGVSLDGVYDTSCNIWMDNNSQEFITPRADKQMALGVSARGEFVMPYLTVGIGLGTNVLHGGGDLKSLYQILALKIDVFRNSYLHIGYNLNEFHNPNHLMLGVGYRFNNKRPKLF